MIDKGDMQNVQCWGGSRNEFGNPWSKRYVTLNTRKGLLTVNRLPFGVASSPAIFQQIMEGFLQGIPGVTIYLDDILITGRDYQEHLHTSSDVLKQLKDGGLRLKREKCAFMQREAKSFWAIEWTQQVFVRFQTKWKLCKKHLLPEMSLN